MRRRFKYVNHWVTKTGIAYVKFRRPGFPSIDLPPPVGSPQFLRAYYAALNATEREQNPVIEHVSKQLGVITSRVRVGSIRKLVKQLAGEEQAEQAGVYLLFLRKKLVWVGSSSNMRERVASHRRNGRPFDRAFYIPASDEDRLWLELILIKALNPPQNRNGRRSENNKRGDLVCNSEDSHRVITR